MPATLDITQGATDNPFADLVAPPANELTLQPKPSDYGAFADLVQASDPAPQSSAAANELVGGGTADAPAFQKVGQNFSDVPRGVAVSTTDYGPFSDLIATEAMPQMDVTTRQFGPFDDLVPPAPAPETQKAVSEADQLHERQMADIQRGPFDALKKLFTDFGDTPLVNIPPEAVKVAAGAILNLPTGLPSTPATEGLSQSGAQTLTSLTTPQNIALLASFGPLASAPAAARMAVSLGFSGYAAFQMGQEIAAAKDEKDPTKFFQHVGNAVTQGAFMTLAGLHGLTQVPKGTPSIQETPTRPVVAPEPAPATATPEVPAPQTETARVAPVAAEKTISQPATRGGDITTETAVPQGAADLPASARRIEVAVRTKSGAVYSIPNNEGVLHAQVIEKHGIDATDIKDTGYEVNGVYQTENPANKLVDLSEAEFADTVKFEVAKRQAEAQIFPENLSRAREVPQLRAGEKQGDLLSTQTEDLALVGEKGIDHGARQTAAEKAAQAAEEARLKQESEQEALDFAQEVQSSTGDELLPAIAKAGGLPGKGSPERAPLKGELDALDEFVRAPENAAAQKLGVSPNQIFRADAPGIDELTTRLRGKGFNFETPNDLIAAVEERMRSGRHYYPNPPMTAGQEMFGAFAEDRRLGILPKPTEFVKQDVDKAVGGLFKAVRQMKAIFAPANMSPESGITARVIRENASELARKHSIATNVLEPAAKLFKKLDPATNLDIINKLETGQPLGSPGLDQYKAARQAGYDERIKQVQAVNPDALQHLIEDYFPHIWTKESVDRVAGNLAGVPADNPWSRIFGKRPLEGTKAFLKQRKIPTTAEGIALGLEPVTTNPVMLDLLKMHEMDRYVMGQKIMGELKQRGLAKFLPAGEKPEAGTTMIDDRIARVMAPRDWKLVDAKGNQMPGRTELGHYYAPDDAARVLNNYLSPGLRGFAPYDAFRFAGNLMNQVQLGFSLYHATFTTIDAATSTVALGLEQLARSGGSPRELLRGAGNIAKGFVEAPVGGALIENLWRGNKFLREYSKPGTTNADLAKIVDAAIAGGARVKMDTMYKTGAVNSFREAIRTGNYEGAVLRAPFAVAEMAAKPLMEFAVPRMKLGIISQNLAYELGRLPKEATRDDIRKISARVVDSVDNRMGQMIYDNLFWNKTLKDGLMASVRSVGWNLGDIRELGGGLLDTATAPVRAYRVLSKGSALADNPIVTKRMTYAVALPLLVGALGSMYQYLMTGEGPKDLRDVYMPRTGKIGPDGSPERVMLPTYMKDIAPLALAAAEQGAVGLVRRAYSMALNKLHPALTTIAQMLQNQDYYGNQIRNENDGLVQTVKKEALFVAKNFRPFSVQGVIQREGGVKEKAQAVIGLMPAPRELTDTPATRLIREINKAKRPAGGYTEAEQLKRDARAARTQGLDLRRVIFKRLSKEDKKRVLEVSTPEEHQIFTSIAPPNKRHPKPKIHSL